MVQGLASELGKLEADSQNFVGTGSPTGFGQIIQAGTASLGAGSSVWVVFGTAFADTPKVVTTYSDLTPTATAGSRVGTGSFLAMGKSASKDVDWIAVGSGNL